MITSPDASDPQCLRASGSLAVATVLSLRGARIGWPLEPAPYDLLVENAHCGIRRVQVKTTSRRAGTTWICDITRSTYANGVGKKRARYTGDDIDDFGIVDGDLVVYLVPFPVLEGLSAIHVRAYDRFRIGRVDVGARV